MRNFIAALALSAFVGPAAFSASLLRADAYYQLEKVTVTEVEPTAEELASVYAPPINTVPPGTLLDGLPGFDWNQIALIGQRIVDLIKANAPVVNVKTDVVHALPLGLVDWQMLAGWQAPMTKVYEIKVQNVFHMNVIDVRVKISAMWGGGAAGRGQYLANISLVPSQVIVAWGWNLDIWTENGIPVNAGSAEAPVAALGFTIRYKVKTYLNEIDGAQDYYLRGDGKLQQLQ